MQLIYRAINHVYLIVYRRFHEKVVDVSIVITFDGLYLFSMHDGQVNMRRRRRRRRSDENLLL
jgi:hypothetical protein